MLAHDIIHAGSAEIVLSGGMESMTNAPYLLAKARGGYRAGHDRIIDHMMMDGLEDAYEVGRSMGDFGEATAEAYQFTRANQDAYAMETLTRARKAVEGGAFKAEIVPITVAEKAGPRTIGNDEIPLKVDPAKIPGLKPAFRANGTITPAASSANADGAAALILAKRSLADRDGLLFWPRSGATPPIARNRNGSPPRRSRRFESCSTRSAGASATSICSRSTRRSRGGDGGSARSRHPQRETEHQWRRLRARTSHRRHRRAPDRDPASRPRSANLRRGVAALCIGGGEATAIAIERIVH